MAKHEPLKPTAWVVGTFDTKSEELLYLAGLIRAKGIRVVTVDVGTRSGASAADISAETVAKHHPQGAAAALENPDRGTSLVAMSQALCAFVKNAIANREIDGMLGVGGSGGTSLIAPAMRLLPIGKPKLLVSTLASGDVSAFVDVVDMTMMYPVTDIAGLNRLSRTILANAAHALAGMLLDTKPSHSLAEDKPAIACSMFGVTTPCVQYIREALATDFDVQVFHANGPGGRAMEGLAASEMLHAVIDITTTEVLQHIMSSVCDAGPGRLNSAAQHNLPWIGSVGALDMVNWHSMSSVPSQYAKRKFHAHNANVTLMRTSASELEQAALRITEQLNRSSGPIRLLLPLNGLSALDAVGQPFHDPVANAALFECLEKTFEVSDQHKLIRLPHHINDPEFARAVVQQVKEITIATS